MSIEALYPIIKPSINIDFASTKSLDPRITFTRASTAVYYDGVTTALAEQNLLLQSQTLTTSPWGYARSSLTINSTTAPDGTNTGLLMVPNTDVNVSHFIVQTSGVSSGLVCTYSIFAKASGYTKIQLFPDSSGNFSARFDLTAVTATFSGSATSANIVSVGNGWYRCSTTFTMGVNSRLDVQPLADSGVTQSSFGDTYTGDGTSGVYLWGAQLEQRSSVTAYNATTTQPITNYVPVLRTALAGQPRFDHNPTTGESLGLFVEEQRTNLLLRSGSIGGTSWIKGGAAVVTLNVGIAPDGNNNASLVETFGNNVYQEISATAGVTYAITFYAKQYGSTTGVGSETSNPSRTFMLTYATGVVTGSADNKSATLVGNGWWKCSYTVTATSTAILTFFLYGGIGYGTSGISYLWGAQLEAGGFPTSYIATVASQVTRSGDGANITGTNFSQWYNQGELTVLSTFSVNSTNVNGLVWNITDNSDTTNISVSVTNLNNILRAVITGTYDTLLNGPVTATYVSNTVALTYKYADGVAGFNGRTDYTPAVNNPRYILPVLRLTIGNVYWGGVPFNGTIKRISYYPYRQSSTRIQALTT